MEMIVQEKGKDNIGAASLILQGCPKERAWRSWRCFSEDTKFSPSLSESPRLSKEKSENDLRGASQTVQGREGG